MTAPALRLVPSVEEVRDRLPDISRLNLPDISHVNLPSFQDVGRQADATVSRLRGRPVRPGWLRPLLVVGVMGVVAAVAAVVLSWSRNRPRRWTDEDPSDRMDGMTESIGSNPGLGGRPDPGSLSGFASPGLSMSGDAELEDQRAGVR